MVQPCGTHSFYCCMQCFEGVGDQMFLIVHVWLVVWSLEHRLNLILAAMNGISYIIAGVKKVYQHP